VNGGGLDEERMLVGLVGEEDREVVEADRLRGEARTTGGELEEVEGCLIGGRAVWKDAVEEEEGLAGEEVGVKKDGRGWVDVFGDEGLLKEREEEGWTGEGMGVDEDVTSSRYRLGGALILLGRSSFVSGMDRSTERFSPLSSSAFDPRSPSTFTSCSSPSRDCFLEAMFPVG